MRTGKAGEAQKWERAQGERRVSRHPGEGARAQETGWAQEKEAKAEGSGVKRGKRETERSAVSKGRESGTESRIVGRSFGRPGWRRKPERESGEAGRDAGWVHSRAGTKGTESGRRNAQSEMRVWDERHGAGKPETAGGSGVKRGGRETERSAVSKERESEPESKIVGRSFGRPGWRRKPERESGEAGRDAGWVSGRAGTKGTESGRRNGPRRAGNRRRGRGTRGTDGWYVGNGGRNRQGKREGKKGPEGSAAETWLRRKREGRAKAMHEFL